MNRAARQGQTASKWKCTSAGEVAGAPQMLMRPFTQTIWDLDGMGNVRGGTCLGVGRRNCSAIFPRHVRATVKWYGAHVFNHTNAEQGLRNPFRFHGARSLQS